MDLDGESTSLKLQSGEVMGKTGSLNHITASPALVNSTEEFSARRAKKEAIDEDSRGEIKFDRAVSTPSTSVYKLEGVLEKAKERMAAADSETY